MFVEGLPYIAYGFSLWALATVLVVLFIGLATCNDRPESDRVPIAFGISMFDLLLFAVLGFLLAVYLIPVSFSLKLVLMGIETSGVMNSC
jgi:CHASE2 domain-containing sensor protein